MEPANGKQPPLRNDVLPAPLRRLVGWWQAASQEERFRLWKASLEGQTEAPPFERLKFAALVAEIEAGEIQEG